MKMLKKTPFILRVVSLMLASLLLGGAVLTGFAGEDEAVPAATEAAASETTGDAAATGEVGDTQLPAVYTLTYEELDAAVLAGSPALRAAALQLDALKHNDALGDAGDAILSAISGMNGMTSAVSNALEGLDYGADNAGATAVALQGVLTLLTGNVTTLQSQVVNMYPKDVVIEQTELGVEQAKAGVTAGARALFTAWHELSDQKAELSQSAAALDRKIEELELRQSLGQVTDLTVEELRVARGKLTVAAAAMDDAMADILCQLSMLVGRDPMEPLALGPMPGPATDFAAGRIIEADKKAALENNIALKLSRLEYSNTKNPNKYEAIAKQRQAMKLKIDASETEVGYKLSKLLKDEAACGRALEQAKAESALAARKLEGEELKYEMGRISKTALIAAQETAATAARAVKKAARDQFLAQAAYTQLVAGVDAS
jgi:outer membrane protein TolC